MIAENGLKLTAEHRRRAAAIPARAGGRVLLLRLGRRAGRAPARGIIAPHRRRPRAAADRGHRRHRARHRLRHPGHRARAGLADRVRACGCPACRGRCCWARSPGSSRCCRSARRWSGFRPRSGCSSIGHTGWGIFLAAYGLLIISGSDNVIRPYFIARGAKLPFLLTILGVLGGALAFGLLGIFLGPVLLGVGFTLVAEFSGGERLAIAELDRVPPRQPSAQTVARAAWATPST